MFHFICNEKHHNSEPLVPTLIHLATGHVPRETKYCHNSLYIIT